MPHRRPLYLVKVNISRWTGLCPDSPNTMSHSWLKCAQRNAMPFSPLTQSSTPAGELSELRSSFQTSTKGKLLMQQAWPVEPAGATERWWGFDCWPQSLYLCFCVKPSRATSSPPPTLTTHTHTHAATSSPLPLLAQFPESFTADSVKYVTVVNHYQHCSERLMDSVSLSRPGITCGTMKLVNSI